MNLLIILSSVLLNAAAQLLLKKAVSNANGASFLDTISNQTMDFLLNKFFLAGMLSYAASIVIWLYVLSKNPVSFSYPFLSIGYIVVTLGAYYFFNERISLINLIGLTLIIIGIILISYRPWEIH